MPPMVKWPSAETTAGSDENGPAPATDASADLNPICTLDNGAPTGGAASVTTRPDIDSPGCSLSARSGTSCPVMFSSMTAHDPVGGESLATIEYRPGATDVHANVPSGSLRTICAGKPITSMAARDTRH